jgi:integrase
MHAKLKGVHRVKFKLATGETATYYYAWRGGPRLVGVPGTGEFLNSFVEAHSQKKQVAEDTMASMIVSYKSTARFKKLGDRTLKDYIKCLDWIQEEFGDLPLVALNNPKITKHFIDWRDGLERSPKWQDYALSVLFILINYGRRNGLTGYVPPSGIEKLYHADRADLIWLPSEIKAFAKVAKPHVWLAFVLALETGQRQGDVIKLPWTSYDVDADDKAWIRLVRDRKRKTDTRQRKTRAAVEIPCTRDLRIILDAAPRTGKTILLNSEGKPWSSGAIQKAMGEAKRKAGIEGLTFHDLRGTTVTRLAEAGCTNAEIASITGHSLDSVAQILATYLGRTRGLALAAIRKLEQKRDGGGL